MNTPISSELLTAIRNLLTQSRMQLQQTVNHTMVKTYWEIGRLIVEEEQKGEKRAAYGQAQIKSLAEDLRKEFGKGFTTRNLLNMRAFYLQNPIWHSVSTKLTWTHHRILLRVQDSKAREWYTQEAIENAWSVRALDRQIDKLYYDRLLMSKDKAPVIQEAEDFIKPLHVDAKNYLRDPYILDFLNLPHQPVVETQLEQALISNLQQFLLELGKGFAFVERQQRIATEDQDFYIDLVFYNFKLKCFLLIDLKIGKLTHQDVGQIDTYVRIYDEHRKGSDDNPTIGLILCSEKNETIAKYSVLKDSKQLFASKYLHYLPTEEELRIELERERAVLNQLPDKD
ncbi:PDDEXK nuclease domain-containing protein [Fluoribacter gormanii]|uniref:PDDEXK nuclease domain-containing protein n=1 Tax=Fluoribacter gormanii TaxID=464 RepID=UPI002244B356|nr:PDDEXK nuclease domain-containing protein [Fluoribacter gormanii]MCW8469370.1 PDDEXK nuclease domain-containing protein [Fluoribacter gormanii]